MSTRTIRSRRRVRTSTALFLVLAAVSASHAWLSFTSKPWLGKEAVYAANGIVSTMHPMASEAGLEILRQGGNAFDAGIAAALALSAVEPWMGGPGGSAYCLVYDAESGEMWAMDASSLAPAAARPEDFTREALSEGHRAMGIPGAMAGYAAVLERFGSMSFGEVVQPALHYLEEGSVLTQFGATITGWLCGHCPEAFPNFGRVFAPNGKLPGTGDIMKNPELARTYRRLAADGVDDFYRGAVASEMVAYMRENGGIWSKSDLADYEVKWRRPLQATYGELEIYGVPPSASSLTWMQILTILEEYDLQAMGHNSTAYVHHFLEAQKLAHADGYQYVADPDFVPSPTDLLLSEVYASVQRRRIDAGRAATGRVRYGSPTSWTRDPDGAELPAPVPAGPAAEPRTGSGEPLEGSTSHIIVADAAGNCFTFTHSLGNIYGGHDVLGTTGVLGSNIMDWFDVEPNVWSGEASSLILAPGKRNRFTLSPGIITAEGKPYILIGGSAAETTMPGIAQVLLNMVEFGLDPQAAIESPRVVYGDVLHWTGGTDVHLEPEVAATIGDSLRALGHEVAPNEGRRPITGHVNAVMIDPTTGHMVGGAEVRADGHVAGY